MMLYIASDQPVPQIRWNDSAPGFHVSEEPPDSPVRKQSGLVHVFYAGAHGTCGCGSQLGEYPDLEDDDAPAKRRSLQQLADYLDCRLAESRELELFACWAGDEAAEPEHHRRISPLDLRVESFFFLEKEHLSVQKTA